MQTLLGQSAFEAVEWFFQLFPAVIAYLFQAALFASCAWCAYRYYLLRGVTYCIKRFRGSLALSADPVLLQREVGTEGRRRAVGGGGGWEEEGGRRRGVRGSQALPGGDMAVCGDEHLGAVSLIPLLPVHCLLP